MMAGIRSAIVQGHVWEFKVFLDSCLHDLLGEWILVLVGAILMRESVSFGLEIGFEF